jgi:hypothetical protein
MNFKLYTKKENTILWKIHFHGKKKKQRVHYILFPLHNFIGWKKIGYNGRKIKRYARSFNNYKNTPMH